MATLFLNAICLWLFTISKNFYLSLFLRFLIGFFQVFICVLSPVWIDIYGPEQKKAIMLTISLLASPLGVVLGYGLTYAMIKHASWEWSFIIQALALLPVILTFGLCPNKFYDVEETIRFR